MKALIEALRDNHAEEARKAELKYRELLHRGGDNDFSPADTKEFKRVAELLGNDLSQVTTDYQVVEEARRLKAIAETAPAADTALEAATKEFDAYVVEQKRIVAEMRARHAHLYNAQAEAGGRVRNANDALQRLADLKRDHAAILEGIDANLPAPPPLEEGGPFEIDTQNPYLNESVYGVRFVKGKGRTTIAQWARHCAQAGYVVRDLSAEPPADAPEAGGVTVTTDAAAELPGADSPESDAAAELSPAEQADRAGLRTVVAK